MTNTRKTGRLIITFYRNDNNNYNKARKYRYFLIKASDPDNIIHTFQGSLVFGETKSYRVTDLPGGNYCLVGLELIDPRPGNPRIHEFMIYGGQDTVYDVNYFNTPDYLERYL